MAVHHQMRECLEFYHQQWAGEQGSLRLGIPFNAFISGWGQRGGTVVYLLTSAVCIFLPPSLTRSPSAFFPLSFFELWKWLFFLSFLFFLKGILSFLSRSFLYLRPDAAKAGTKDKCYTIPSRGMERW